MDSLPPIRLYCGRCHCLREISEFPFRRDGYRQQNCLFCQYQQLDTCQREREARQQGCETQRSGEREEYEDTAEYGGSESRYCSACNQRRKASLFGRFRTCELCRSTNKKSLSRKRKREKEEEKEKENLAPTERREQHLYTWVKLRGEEAVKTATKYVDNVAPPTLRPSRALTIEDYSKEGGLTSFDVRSKLRERRRQQEQYKKFREALQARGYLRPPLTDPWNVARHKELLDGKAIRRAVIQEELYQRLEMESGQELDSEQEVEVEVDGGQEVNGGQELDGGQERDNGQEMDDGQELDDGQERAGAGWCTGAGLL